MGDEEIVCFLSTGGVIRLPRDNRFVLQLDANTCFFGPIGRLLGVYDDSKDGQGLPGNDKKYLSHISRWDQVNDTILWAVNFRRTGVVWIAPRIEVGTKQAGAEIAVKIGSQEKTIVLKPANKEALQQELSFTIDQPGIHLVSFILKDKKTATDAGLMYGCQLRGETVKDAAYCFGCWRQESIHCGFQNSSKPGNVVITVIESVVKYQDIWQYFPVTTPFGYTGVSWDNNKRQFGGINFSLWRDNGIPIEQYSYLVAVGKGMDFGGFGHEGSGVKPRADNPYDGYHTNRAVIGVRMVPGRPYNTYYSFYLDPKEGKEWVFFGCGRQYNKTAESKPLSYLSTGSFVEVIAPPNQGRSGHRMREIWMKGWCVTEDGKKMVIDQMQPTGALREDTYKNWTQKEGYFVMQSQSAGFQEQKAPQLITIDGVGELPEFMSDEKMSVFYKLPAEMKAESPMELTGNSVKL